MKTFYPEIRNYWGERGFGSKVLYERCGMPLWEIDVDAERIEEEVANCPEYKAILVGEEKHQYDVIESRFFGGFSYAEAIATDTDSASRADGASTFDSVIHVGVKLGGVEAPAVAVSANKDDFPGEGALKGREVKYVSVTEPTEVVAFLALTLDVNTKHVGFCVRENGEEAVEVYTVDTLIHVVLRKGITEGTLDTMEVIQALKRGHAGVVGKEADVGAIGDATRKSETLH